MLLNVLFVNNCVYLFLKKFQNGNVTFISLLKTMFPQDACSMNMVIYRCKIFLNRMKSTMLPPPRRCPAGQGKSGNKYLSLCALRYFPAIIGYRTLWVVCHGFPGRNHSFLSESQVNREKDSFGHFLGLPFVILGR